MIRLNFPLRRLPNQSRAEFQKYWREEHGPLVASFATKLRIRRYVQTHTLDDPLYDGLRGTRPGMEEPHDGIASLWWDTRAEFERAMQDDAARRAGAALLEDEKKFIDLRRSSIFVAEEKAQINPLPENSIVASPRSSIVKFSYLLNPKAGMSWQDCHRTWNMDHGYLLRRHSGETRFLRYVQSHTLIDPLNDLLRAGRECLPPYAGLTEAWFDRQDLVAIFADPDGEGAKGFNTFLEDEKRFIDFTKSSVFGSKELVFIDRHYDY